MENKALLKPVYIVISQTGTILSRILKLITHKSYNHVSISLADDLHIMYSFGRKTPYNPFKGGFVKESAEFGTFKRFTNTKVIVIKTMIPYEKYEELVALVDFMTINTFNYKYNYVGLCLAAFKIRFSSKNRYYCSEFVREILIKHNVNGADKLKKIVHPMSFLSLPEIQMVYCGKLKDFSCENRKQLNNVV